MAKTTEKNTQKTPVPSTEFKTEATIIGRVAADPKVTITKNNKKVVKFSVAVPESSKEDAHVNFYNITCFGKVAENAEKFIKKGKALKVVGRLAVDAWEKDGVKHTLTYVIANRTEYLS